MYICTGRRLQMWVKSGETVSEMSSKLSPISILGRVEFAFFLHPAAALTILFRCAKLCAKRKWNCVQKEYYFMFNFMYFCVQLCSLLQAATHPNPLSAQCPASWFCNCAKIVCKHCVHKMCSIVPIRIQLCVKLCSLVEAASPIP